MKNFKIEKPNQALLDQINHKIDHKTKPLGALGVLEEISKKICLVQQTLSPALNNPNLVVFAADHGLANDGVSAYPQEVTHQMVLNFLAGGAAINVFSEQHGIELQIVDAGVNFDFNKVENLIDYKIDHGTKSSLHGKAMTETQFNEAIDKGAEIVSEIYQSGCNIIGCGEMGIGNTSAASLIMSHVCKLPIEECVGRGTGVDDDGFQRKIEILKSVQSKHKTIESIDDLLQSVGGFEIVMMYGAMLQAASLKMIVLVDGFIASSAFLCALQTNPNIKHYTIFCHQSDESGHEKMLDFMNEKAILNLGMRLGEGTGCAVAFPLIASSVDFMNNMASFESASVSEKS